MTNLEQRVFRLEIELRQAQQLIRDLQVGLGKLKQDQFAGVIAGGGGGGGANVLVCVISSALGAGGVPGTTPPAGPITNQSVYIITGGVFTLQSSTASIFNGIPNAIASGKQCLLNSNPDGTFTVAAVMC